MSICHLAVSEGKKLQYGLIQWSGSITHKIAVVCWLGFQSFESSNYMDLCIKLWFPIISVCSLDGSWISLAWEKCQRVNMTEPVSFVTLSQKCQAITSRCSVFPGPTWAQYRHILNNDLSVWRQPWRLSPTTSLNHRTVHNFPLHKYPEPIARPLNYTFLY